MPMEKDRYPENWRSLSHEIKEQAKWTCQRCYRPCRRPDETFLDVAKRLHSYPALMAELQKKPRRFVLTVAHLDQNPANNQPENLKALCAYCHLDHDRAFIPHNRYRKRERRGQLRLMLGV